MSLNTSLLVSRFRLGVLRVERIDSVDFSEAGEPMLIGDLGALGYEVGGGFRGNTG
jgi:hypothetical protein